MYLIFQFIQIQYVLKSFNDVSMMNSRSKATSSCFDEFNDKPQGTRFLKEK